MSALTKLMDARAPNMLLLLTMASLAYNRSSTRKFAHHQKLHSQASSENRFYPRKYLLATPAQPQHMRTSFPSWIATNLRGHSNSCRALTSGRRFFRTSTDQQLMFLDKVAKALHQKLLPWRANTCTKSVPDPSSARRV